MQYLKDVLQHTCNMKNNIILEDNILACAKNVGMKFRLREKRADTLKERFVALFRGENKHKDLVVLKDISFEIKRGESLGVIGHNGAGKSTLLKIVAGIFRPSEGAIATNGRVVLLNLGAGFDMEASAEENVFLNGAILGFTRKQMRERYNSIVEFSELGKFMKMPLKNFSSGMVSRLGFAIAIDVRPDLMLVDEVLSVGDANFSKKCMAKIEELKRDGVSFMFVSHSIGQVQRLCEKTLWIENSEVKEYGESKEVCTNYLKYCSELNERTEQKQPDAPKLQQAPAQNVAAKTANNDVATNAQQTPQAVASNDNASNVVANAQQQSK